MKPAKDPLFICLPAICAVLAVCLGAPALAQDSLATPPPTSDPGAEPTALSTSSSDLDDLEPQSKLRVDFTAWIWLTSMEGDLSIGDRSADASASFLDIVEDSDSLFSLSGSLVVSYGRFGVFMHGIYSDIGADNQTGPLGVSDVDLTFETAIMDFGLSYRLAEWEATGSAVNNDQNISLDVYGGGRLVWTSSELNPANLPASSRDENWVDPIIGARVVLPISERWYLSLSGDIGGFGVGSDLTWSTTGFFGYKFLLFDHPAAFTFGYRALNIDYSRGSGDREVEIDITLHGPLIGLSLQF